MDYIKVKVSHVLMNDLTDSEVGQLVRFQATIAFKQRPLSEFEKNLVFSSKKLQKISKFLEENDNVSLQKVQQKVLEDVQEVVKKKEFYKEKKRSQRAKTTVDKESVPGDIEGTVVGDVPDPGLLITSLDKLSLDKHVLNKQQAASSILPPAFLDNEFLRGKYPPGVANHSEYSLWPRQDEKQAVMEFIFYRRLAKAKKIGSSMAIWNSLEKVSENNLEIGQWRLQFDDFHAKDDEAEKKKARQKELELKLDRQNEIDRIESNFREIPNAEFLSMDIKRLEKTEFKELEEKVAEKMRVEYPKLYQMYVEKSLPGVVSSSIFALVFHEHFKKQEVEK